MSVREGYSDVGYCTPQDVMDLLEQHDVATEDTTPKESEIERSILKWSDYIDRNTGHAWRERQVVNEFHDLDSPYYYWSGKPVPLMKREIRDFKEEKGDKIEIWRGGGYQDLVSDPSMTQGRDGDFWVDGPNGILYIYQRLIYPRNRGIRVTYRYGHGSDENERETIPKDIEMACAKFVAKDVVTNERYDIVVPGSEGGGDRNRMIDELQQEAEKVLKHRKEVRKVY